MSDFEDGLQAFSDFIDQRLQEAKSLTNKEKELLKEIGTKISELDQCCEISRTDDPMVDAEVDDAEAKAPPSWVVRLPDLIWRERLIPFISALDVRHVAVTCRAARKLIKQIAPSTLIETPYSAPGLYVEIDSDAHVEFVDIAEECRHRSGDLKTDFGLIDDTSHSVHELPEVIALKCTTARRATFTEAHLEGLCRMKSSSEKVSMLRMDMYSAFADVFKRLTTRFAYRFVHFDFCGNDVHPDKMPNAFWRLIIDCVTSLPHSMKVRISVPYFPCFSLSSLWGLADLLLTRSVELEIHTYFWSGGRSTFVAEAIIMRDHLERRRKELGSECAVVEIDELTEGDMHKTRTVTLWIKSKDGRLSMVFCGK